MSWRDLMQGNPDLAKTGEARLNGRVSYLGTVRKNGAPRVHPVTPFIGERRLFLFMEPTSPKGKDIQRDGRYALHCGVESGSGGEGEFFVWGRGKLVEEPETRALATKYCPYQPAERYVLFELGVERAMATVYDAEGEPVRSRWRAG